MDKNKHTTNTQILLPNSDKTINKKNVSFVELYSLQNWYETVKKLDSQRYKNYKKNKKTIKFTEDKIHTHNKSKSVLKFFLLYFQHHLYRSLGLNLIICDPPEDQKLSILSEVLSSFMIIWWWTCVLSKCAYKNKDNNNMYCTVYLVHPMQH